VTLLPLKPTMIAHLQAKRAARQKPDYPDLSCVKLTPEILGKVKQLQISKNLRGVCRRACKSKFGGRLPEPAITAYGCACAPKGVFTSLKPVAMSGCKPSKMLPEERIIVYNIDKNPKILAGHPTPTCVRLKSGINVEKVLGASYTVLTSGNDNCVKRCKAQRKNFGIFTRNGNRCVCANSLDKIPHEVMSAKACKGRPKPEEAYIVPTKTNEMLKEIVNDRVAKPKCYPDNMYDQLGLKPSNFIVPGSKRDCFRMCSNSQKDEMAVFAKYGCACAPKARVAAIRAKPTSCSRINIRKYTIVYKVPFFERYTVFIGQNRYRCYTAPEKLPAALTGPAGATADTCKSACVKKGGKYVVMRGIKCHCLKELTPGMKRLNIEECRSRMSTGTAVGVIPMMWYANLFGFVQTMGAGFLRSACVKPDADTLEKMLEKVELNVVTMAGCQQQCSNDDMDQALLLRSGCACITNEEARTLTKLSGGCTAQDMLTGQFMLQLTTVQMYETLLGYKNWHCRYADAILDAEVDLKPITSKSCSEMCSSKRSTKAAIMSTNVETGETGCACVKDTSILDRQVSEREDCLLGSEGYAAVVSYSLKAMYEAFDAQKGARWCLKTDMTDLLLPATKDGALERCTGRSRYTLLGRNGVECISAKDAAASVEKCGASVGGAAGVVRSGQMALLVRHSWSQWVAAIGGGYEYYTRAAGPLMTLEESGFSVGRKSMSKCQTECVKAKKQTAVVVGSTCWCGDETGISKLQALGFTKTTDLAKAGALYADLQTIAVSTMGWSVWPASIAGDMQVSDFKCFVMPKDTSSWIKLSGLYNIKKAWKLCAKKQRPLIAMTADGAACLASQEGLVPAQNCKTADLVDGKFFAVSTSTIWETIYTGGSEVTCYSGLGSHFTFYKNGARGCKDACLDQKLPYVTIAGTGCGCVADTKAAVTAQCDFDKLQRGRQVFLVNADTSDQMSFTTVTEGSHSQSVEFSGVSMEGEGGEGSYSEEEFF